MNIVNTIFVIAIVVLTIILGVLLWFYFTGTPILPEGGQNEPPVNNENQNQTNTATTSDPELDEALLVPNDTTASISYYLRNLPKDSPFVDQITSLDRQVDGF